MKNDQKLLNCLPPGTRVAVHLNLHRRNWKTLGRFTLRQNGKVIGYSDGITLNNVSFVVNPAGLQQFHFTKRKSPFAFVCGAVTDEQVLFRPDFRVNFNPAQHTQFQLNGRSILKAEYCQLFYRGEEHWVLARGAVCSRSASQPIAQAP